MNDALQSTLNTGVQVLVGALVAIAIGAIRKLWAGGTVDKQAAAAALKESAAAEADRLMQQAVLATEEKFAAGQGTPAPAGVNAKQAFALNLFQQQGGKVDANTDTLLHAVVADLPQVGATGKLDGPAD